MLNSLASLCILHKLVENTRMNFLIHFILIFSYTIPFGFSLIWHFFGHHVWTIWVGYPIFLMNQKKLFMALELKFNVINNPNWSNFVIIYGFHGFPLHRFDRFNAVHYMVALTGFMRYFICRIVLKTLHHLYLFLIVLPYWVIYINKILSSCTFIIYRIKGFHSDHIYTDWPLFIEIG